jgi:membrane-bound ClpP family serine protease
MAKKEKEVNTTGFALGKENYKLMAIGFAVIVLGFILMAGGGSDDPNVFNPDIFSFRRLTIAPVVLLAGFVFEIYAIMKKPKEDK